MTILLLIVLFGALAAVLLDGDWRAGLVVTLIIALILWLFDQVFGNLTSMLLGG